MGDEARRKRRGERRSAMMRGRARARRRGSMLELIASCGKITLMVGGLLFGKRRGAKRVFRVYEGHDEDEQFRRVKRRKHEHAGAQAQAQSAPWWPLLPPQSASNWGKPTLLLDLDQTLIHNSSASLTIYCRPNLAPFLSAAARSFELVIFTSSSRRRASKIVSQLDPHGLLFSHILYRDSCTLLHHSYIKDLSRLGRDLRRVLIVDNNPNCFRFQPHNGIHVPPFLGDPSDQILPLLLDVLDRLKDEEDLASALIRMKLQAQEAQEAKLRAKIKALQSRIEASQKHNLSEWSFSSDLQKIISIFGSFRGIL